MTKIITERTIVMNENAQSIDEVMTIRAKAIADIITEKIHGNITVNIYGENVKVNVSNFGFKFHYTIYDVYWASFYGVSAETLADQFLKCYNRHIQKQFFK